jgi:hypothetical protein
MDNRNTQMAMKRQIRSSLVTTPFAHTAVRASVVACSALLAIGCNGAAPRDLGASSIPLASVDETEALTPQAFIGSWVGVAHDALALTDTGEPAPLAFASGSSAIRLVVHGDGVHPDRFASLVFGEGEPPPAPTDPDAPPPGIPPEFIDSNPVNTPPLEGFAYALNPVVIPSESTLDGSFGLGDNNFDLTDGILRLGFNADQIFEDYCALQPVGANKMGCDCDATSCQRSADNPIYLWLRHSPTGLAGVVSGSLSVFNARDALTSLGQIQFTPEE